MQTNQTQLNTLQFAKIKFDPIQQQNGLVSLKDFKKDSIICHFSAAEILPYPSRYTVQIADDKHIILTPLFLEYINHSCEPNCFFDTKQFKLKALRDIQSGEEFCFFYPSTEWDMQEAFECQCGSKNCIQYIQGAQHLSPEHLDNYQFTYYIQQKLKKAYSHVF